MREDVIKSVESVLYDFPDLCRDVVLMERYYEAGSSPSESGPVQGGPEMPAQQRVVESKERDGRMKTLNHVVGIIQEGMKELTDDTREIVDRLFFRRESMKYAADEMGYTVRTIYNKKYSAMRQMRETCLEVYKIVKRWQYERDEDRIEAVMMKSRREG